MTALFLDTSSFIQVGLLNDSFEWIHYELIKNKKGSQILHGLIHETLKENGLSIKDIDRLIVANGPGSYTGIRLAEGLAQVLELNSIKVANFYHFEVPSFLGHENYLYLASAFKNEYFYYQSRCEEKEKMLISQSQFDELTESSTIFHIGDEVGGRVFQPLYQFYEKRPKDIFQKVVELDRRFEPFYFRPLDKEFTASGV